MRVLLNDGMEEDGLRVFEEAGISADDLRLSPEALLDRISEYDGLVVRSATKVTRDVIESGSRGKLKVVGRAGVGYDNIDVAAATEKGIIVMNAPNGNTNAAAELAVGLMLAVSRKIPQADAYLKAGEWRKRELEGTELSGKVLGIIGCGRIGRRVAEIAHGFDIDVLGYDLRPGGSAKIKYVSMDDLLRQADYVTIHTGGKRTIIGERELLLMKPTAYLINVSRGENVDCDALCAALKEGRLAGAAIDTHMNEPKKDGPGFASKLAEFGSRVVLTPHLGASTTEAQRETSKEIATCVAGYLLRNEYTNAVNVGESLEAEESKFYRVFVHHADVPGVFEKISGTFATHNVNIREISSRKMGEHAITTYIVQSEPDRDVLAELRGLANVYRVTD
ncbi:MAG: NAD(P)-dependent oxidoreductase [Candidatus Aenigmatarchaeota archaeon]